MSSNPSNKTRSPANNTFGKNLEICLKKAGVRFGKGRRGTLKEWCVENEIPYTNVQKALNQNFVLRWDYLVKFSKIFNVTVDWLLTGESTRDAAIDNVVELSYVDIIKKFADKSYVAEINKDLVELEKINPEAYKRVGVYVKGVLEGAKNAQYTGPERRESERRQSNSDFDGDERRSGNDRRKSSGQ